MRWQVMAVALFDVAMAMIIFRRETLRMLIEQIENLNGNFRGGPPTPMHPLQSDDRRLLLRRARRKRTQDNCG